MISLNEAQCALQQELQVTPVTALRLLNQFVKLDYEQFVGFYKQVQDTYVDSVCVCVGGGEGGINETGKYLVQYTGARSTGRNPRI